MMLGYPGGVKNDIFDFEQEWKILARSPAKRLLSAPANRELIIIPFQHIIAF